MDMQEGHVFRLDYISHRLITVWELSSKITTQIPVVNHADHDYFNQQFILETMLKLQRCFWADESRQTQTFSELRFSLENSL